MKLFRNQHNNKLYYFAWKGRGKTISRPKYWNHWYAFSYYGDDSIYIGKYLDFNKLRYFKLVTEI